MTTVQLKPSVEPFPASTGDLYLLRSDGGGDVVLRQAPPFARALVNALSSGRPQDMGNLAATGLGSESRLREAVGALDAAGVVVHGRRTSTPSALSPAEAERYDRQLHYFTDQASRQRNPEAMQLALREATVVVLGAGGLGSWTMAGLACAGVGRIVAVDDDVIALSNLNRQILYRTCDIGKPKVGVAGAALRAVNPDLDFVAVARRITGVADVRAIAQGADYVVCTADSPVHKIGSWVNEACLELALPHVSAGQFPPRVRVGPTFVPGQTACLACQEAQMRRDFALYDELVAHRQQATPVAATLGAASGLIGSLLAMEIIHWLTGICAPATLGRGLVLDLRDFSTHWEAIAPDLECELRCASRVLRPTGANQAPPETSGD
jgi:molybdopterin-synthase adenylyltransferase